MKIIEWITFGIHLGVHKYFQIDPNIKCFELRGHSLTQGLNSSWALFSSISMNSPDVKNIPRFFFRIFPEIAFEFSFRSNKKNLKNRKFFSRADLP